MQLGSGIGTGASWHTCFCTHLHSGPPGTLSISVYGIGKQYSRSPSWSHLLEKRNLFTVLFVQRKILNYKKIFVKPTYRYVMSIIITQKFSRSKCIFKFYKIFEFYTYTILLILYLRRTDSGRHSTSPSGKVWTYLCTTVRGRQLFTMNVITPSFGSLVTLFDSRKVYSHVRKRYSINYTNLPLQVEFLFYKYLIFRDS